MRVNVLKKRAMESSEPVRTARNPSRVKTRVRLTRSLQDLSTAMADALEDILRAERMSRLSH
ncbi:MAG: hypothetical protein ABIP89_05400 [Polyangiaceae bacterium]